MCQNYRCIFTKYASAARFWYRKAGLVNLCKRAGVYFTGAATVGVTTGGYADTLLTRRYFQEPRDDISVWKLDDELEGLSGETCSELIPLQGEDSLKFKNSPRYEFDRPFVVALEDVLVSGPHAVVVTNDRKVIHDSASDNVERTRWMLNSAIAHRPRTLWAALRHGPNAVDGKPVSVGIVLYHVVG